MNKILPLLLEKIIKYHEQIEQFFQNKFQENPPLFYNSVDLRHSGFKIAPVDTNCFPAGFNNLSAESRINAKKIIDDFFSKNFPDTKKILILPENHTRNLRYLENILTLQETLQNQDREVLIGSLITENEGILEIDLENNQKISLQKIFRNGNKIATKNGFTPDIIISNNDFTDGIPEILQDLDQPIIPPTRMGWHIRKKSVHFTNYNQIVSEFCQIINLDPWLISTMHHNCSDVDFKEQKGIECLAKYVDKLITALQEKYQQYGIESEPYCYVKSDNGTYGMAIMTVKSGADILEINKKERNKMNSIKGSIQNTTAIIQEGIPTSDLVKFAIAEPLIYLINGKVVGNLFRINDARDVNISLNATGMSFGDINNLSDADLSLGLEKNDIIQIYSLIARLSALAAACEKY